MLHLLSTIAKRRTVHIARWSIILSARFWKGFIFVAASLSQRRWILNGWNAAKRWPKRTKTTENHFNIKPTASIQSIIRNVTETMPQNSRSISQRYRIECASGASLVPGSYLFSLFILHASDISCITHLSWQYMLIMETFCVNFIKFFSFSSIFVFRISAPRWRKYNGNRNRMVTKHPIKIVQKMIKVCKLLLIFPEIAHFHRNKMNIARNCRCNNFIFHNLLIHSDYLGNSNDSFCSSDISLDGSNFDNLDEATSDTLSLQNLDLHASHIHSNLLEGNAAAASNASNNIGNVNPIDKLYLMQNSYFNSEQWNFDDASQTNRKWNNYAMISIICISKLLNYVFFLSLLVKSKARLLFKFNLFSYGIWKFNRIYRIDSFEQQQQPQQVIIKSWKHNQKQNHTIPNQSKPNRRTLVFKNSFYQKCIHIHCIYLH